MTSPSFLQLSDRDARIFARAFAHPVIGRYAQYVPLQWLLALSNPDPVPYTDLGDWTSRDKVSLDTLYEDLLDKGMRDPLLLGVGRVCRHVRLEAGNHRVRVLLAKGHVVAPAVAYVGDCSIHRLGNGPHKGEEMDLTLPKQADIMGPYPVMEYMRPSDVLVLAGNKNTSAARLGTMGMLDAQHGC